MSDSKELDPSLCPIHGKQCLQEAQIVALEDTLDKIHGELKRLNTWVPGVDATLDRLSLQSGMVASGVEELMSNITGVRNDVTELQEIVRNGNGAKEGKS